ncbi:MAG: amidohydrolase [Herminiimonas sp.]|nr:amidohydrolase [Herminiimonas sp.]
MTTNSFLITNATAIMSGLPAALARHDGPDIRVAGGVIAEIGKLAALPGERVIDASDCVVYPAWVNTHHHLFQSLLKGDPAGINHSLTDWLATTPYRYQSKFDEGMFRIAVRIGLVELVRSGCGTVADHNYLYFPGMPFDTSAILFDEAEKLGLRFALCRGGATQTRLLEAELPPHLKPESYDDYLQDVERLTAKYHDASPAGMRRVALAPTTPLDSVSPSQLREMAAFSRKLGIHMHTHLSETVSYQDTARSRYQCSPTEFMGRHDWLGPDVWFAHLVKLGNDEISLLGKSGTGIAHCPQSNGRLGSGIAPVRELEEAGVTVSIGVDGAASNEAADMISETHAAWLMQRARKGELAQAAYAGGTFEGGAGAAAVEDVIRWGTTGGARILGLSGVNGISIGASADIAIYSLDDPRYFGLHDPAIGPVAAGGRPFLKRLFVAGKTVVEEDRIPGFDMAEFAYQARQATRRLLSPM